MIGAVTQTVVFDSEDKYEDKMVITGMQRCGTFVLVQIQRYAAGRC